MKQIPLIADETIEQRPRLIDVAIFCECGVPADGHCSHCDEPFCGDCFEDHLAAEGWPEKVESR